jgi:hypothetical protein
MRFKHYSIRTETTYHDWTKRFILFHDKRHPREMGAPLRDPGSWRCFRGEVRPSLPGLPGYFARGYPALPCWAICGHPFGIGDRMAHGICGHPFGIGDRMAHGICGHPFGIGDRMAHGICGHPFGIGDRRVRIRCIPNPGGFKDGSRGLRGAIPPVSCIGFTSTPGGVAERSGCICHPSGMRE